MTTPTHEMTFERCSLEDKPHMDAIPAYLIEASNQIRKVKAQKLQCDTACQESLSVLVSLLCKAQKELGQTADDDMNALDRIEKELEKKLNEIDAVGTISKSTKSLHGAVAKLGKTMDTAYKNTDLAKGCLTHELDKNMLDRMVFEHLYISGDFAAGDILAEEAEIQDVVQVKEQFHELCRIEGLLLEHKLSAALDWAERHADTLKENVTRPDFLGFLLHRLKFLEVLKNEGAVEGIKYARKHLVQYYESHNEELRMLLGSLAFYKGFGADMDVDSYATEVKSRYSCFWGDDEHLLWEQVRKEFRRQFCYVIGQPQDSPLLVAVAAGTAVLPTLLKYAEVAAKTKSVTPLDSNIEQLPIELPLPDEFIYHSTFTCPVSKESNSEEDPAMLLPCGHCLNKSSILKIAKSASRKFKCPYCPLEAQLSQCMALKFPVV